MITAVVDFSLFHFQNGFCSARSLPSVAGDGQSNQSFCCCLQEERGGEEPEVMLDSIQYIQIIYNIHVISALSVSCVTFKSVKQFQAQILNFVDRNQLRFRGIGSTGGARLQRLNTASTWDCICPPGGTRVSVSSCGSTTPATSLTSKPRVTEKNNVVILNADNTDCF